MSLLVHLKKHNRIIEMQFYRATYASI